MDIVEVGYVAQYVDSSLDERGITTRSVNCIGDWTPDWPTFGTEMIETKLRTMYVAMGLRLTRAMQPYDQLLYKYYWGKFERESGRALSGPDMFAELMQAGAPRGGERAKRGPTAGIQKHCAKRETARR